MNQADRLRAFIAELLESPHSFSIGIGLPTSATIYEVINKNRPISQKLLKRIIDTYPNLNPEWLLNGTNPKLLTGKSTQKEGDLINEERTIYNSKCKECNEKDKEIETLKSEIIELQRQIIEQLKKTSG